MTAIPRDLKRTYVGELLDRVKAIRGVGPRIAAISERFMGAPYLTNPLVGSPATDEVFTASLDGFDCVTYVESVLALARAATPAAFAANLRRIRYASGVVGWKTRNHYMTGWIRRNRQAGIVRDRTRGSGLVERSRRLNGIEGVGESTVKVRSIRKRDFLRRAGEIRTGDLAFFASTRPRHDIFHCGILVRKGDRIVMRHAARSRGRVVEQDLDAFISENRMAGVILVRPEEAEPEVA